LFGRQNFLMMRPVLALACVPALAWGSSEQVAGALRPGARVPASDTRYCLSLPGVQCQPPSAPDLSPVERSAAAEPAPSLMSSEAPKLPVVSEGPVPESPEPTPAPRESIGIVDYIEKKAKAILKDGQAEYYVPLYAYHDRFTYTKKSVEKLNEYALGYGVGKYAKNAKGDVETVYFMAHLDSARNVQLNLGYSWARAFEYSGIDFTLGYALGLVSRKDIAHRIPVPFLFPTLGFSVTKDFTMGGVFIPKVNGGVNHGNVLFLFLKHDMAQ